MCARTARRARRASAVVSDDASGDASDAQYERCCIACGKVLPCRPIEQHDADADGWVLRALPKGSRFA